MELSTAKWMDLSLATIDDCAPKIKVRSANSAFNSESCEKEGETQKES